MDASFSETSVFPTRQHGVIIENSYPHRSTLLGKKYEGEYMNLRDKKLYEDENYRKENFIICNLHEICFYDNLTNRYLEFLIQ
jgi:hypothetical protein